jgi:hypothetical protein
LRARPHHRRIVLALVLSIAAHTALFTLTKMKPPELVMAGSTPQEAMSVRLIDTEASAPAPSTTAQPPLPTPSPPRPVPIPPLPTPRITRRSPTGTEPPPTPPEPQPPAPRPPAIPELDMAAMIEARGAGGD